LSEPQLNFALTQRSLR